MPRLPLNNRILSGIAKKGGNRLIDRAVADILPKVLPATGKKPGIAARLAGMALIRLATRSVPGAILVGGGLLAKALHEKRQEQRNRAAAAAVPVGPGASRKPVPVRSPRKIRP